MELIEVDPNTNNPVEVWAKYRAEGRVCLPQMMLGPETPIFEDKIRFVCISDTHELLHQLLNRIPDGDVFIHTGDFTNSGDLGQVIKFNAELGVASIVIAGNHEFGFQHGEKVEKTRQAGLNILGIEHGHQLLTNCTYLCDQEIQVFGLRIYGTPWHPLPNWPFSASRGQCLLSKWERIPANIDVLLTHTPPLGHGDYSELKWFDQKLAGCVELLNSVEKRVRPKVHIFGHIHDKHGTTTNGKTVFINASICNRKLQCVYDPVLFDLPLPFGHTKTTI